MFHDKPQYSKEKTSEKGKDRKSKKYHERDSEDYLRCPLNDINSAFDQSVILRYCELVMGFADTQLRRHCCQLSGDAGSLYWGKTLRKPTPGESIATQGRMYTMVRGMNSSDAGKISYTGLCHCVQTLCIFLEHSTRREQSTRMERGPTQSTANCRMQCYSYLLLNWIPSALQKQRTIKCRNRAKLPPALWLIQRLHRSLHNDTCENSFLWNFYCWWILLIFAAFYGKSNIVFCRISA